MVRRNSLDRESNHCENIELPEGYAHGLVLEPREPEGAINETRMDKYWVVGSFIQPHLDFFVPDKDFGWGVNVFSKDDSSAAMFVSPEMLCEHLICCLSHKREQNIKVNSDGYRR